MSDPVNIHEEVQALCDRLGVVPSYVSSVVIEPSQVTVTAYKGKDGQFKGAKYMLPPDLKEPAMESIRFEVLT